MPCLDGAHNQGKGGCTLYFELPRGGCEEMELTCRCGERCCTAPACWEEAHFPCRCADVREWQSKCDSDGGLYAWISQNMARPNASCSVPASALNAPGSCQATLIAAYKEDLRAGQRRTAGGKGG